MLQPNRHKDAKSYRYGFNSFEKDDEVKGSGNHISFNDYGYDPRVVTRWTTDPVDKPFESPYAVFGGNPILFYDRNGQDWFHYQKKGENKPGFHWSEGSKLTITTGSDNAGNAITQTLEGHKSVVVFNGSRDEKLGANNNINGAGAVTAGVTVYGPGGADDIKTYKGFTMTSDASKFTPTSEGVFTATRRASKGSSAIPKHFQMFENGKDNLRTMDGAPNIKVPSQVRSNGEGFKTEIFIHRTNNSGFAGTVSSGKSGVSTGCLLLCPTSMKGFEQQLSPLGNGTPFTVILNREGSNQNSVLDAPIEQSTPSTSDDNTNQ